MSVANITEEQKMVLLFDFAGSSRGMWHTGHQLPAITKRLAEMFGNATIKIEVPYHNFFCNGPADVIHKEVYGQMPFSKAPVAIEDVTTLFYGGALANWKGVFLPFWAETDCFRIKEIEGNVIKLENDISWRAFL